MSSGLDFGALSLGGARFVPCGSSSQLYRGRTGLCPALFLTGISQSDELAIRKSYHGEQSGVHRAGGASGSGLGTCVGLFVSLSSADCMA